jgi:hypothetical protein
MKLILILLALATPLIAEWTATHTKRIVEPSKRYEFVFTFSNSETGAQATIIKHLGNFDGCVTTASNRVLACMKQWVYKEIQKRNARDSMFETIPNGPMIGELAPVAPPKPDDPENTALDLFSRKYGRLKGCVEGVRLGMLTPLTCDSLKAMLFTRWTELTAPQKLKYLEHMQ